MKKETKQQQLIRVLRRTSLDQVRSHYFNTTWTSYQELKTYFEQNGWTRGELAQADRPRGSGDARWEKRVLYWYLSGFPDTSLLPDQSEIDKLEQEVATGHPCIITTSHGYYESDILYFPTFKQMLKCVRESIYVNKDPDHRGVNLPTVTTHNDGGPDHDVTYHIINFSMDS